jgi:Apea-like HEPN
MTERSAPLFTSKSMLTVGQPEPSRYIRTTGMLSARAVLSFAGLGKVRFFSVREATELAEQVRRRNVFARHSWENNFYLRRVNALADHTVLEVFRPGDPNDIGEKAEQLAMSLERIAVLSSSFTMHRSQLQRKLGIRARRRPETNLMISPGFHFLRSRARAAPPVQGVLIDEHFCKRFSRCGFNTLAECVQSRTDIAKRVSRSLDWLFDSRTEPRLEAAVVKTSIALESLLIFSESESLAQSLSERAAFTLSSDPDRRHLISRTLKRFYDARSGVVHGGEKKVKKLTPTLLETIDRIAILLSLVIAANTRLWQSASALRDWCEGQRWGEPSREVRIPFPGSYLRKALAMSQRELEPATTGVV